MFRRIFHKPSSNNGQIRSIHQNRIRLENTQRRNTQKQISNAMDKIAIKFQQNRSQIRL